MWGTPSSTPAFGTPSSTPAFGTPSTPAFGTPSSTLAFGTPSSTPAFGTPPSTPAFGAPSSAPAFGTPSSAPAFGTPSTPAFGTPSSTPAFGTPSTPAFGTPSSTSAFGTPSTFAFGTPSTPSFATPTTNPFASTSSLFSTPSSFSSQQQQTPSLFPNVPQLTTQMAPVAPLPSSLVERDVQAIVDAYKDDPLNPKFSFRHLLLSVMDPASRPTPMGISDTMWGEAIGKLEGMDRTNRERLWPELVEGFKGLSHRLKIQDEVIVSDAETLKAFQTRVKMLQRHFQAETLPWIQRLRQKEQSLQRRLLRIMRIIEALEGRGSHLLLTQSEVELGDKLSAIVRQLKSQGNGLSVRVHNLLSNARMRADAAAVERCLYLPASTKIDERNFVGLQEALHQQIEAIGKMGNALKRDTRNMEIILSGSAGASESGARLSS